MSRLLQLAGVLGYTGDPGLLKGPDDFTRAIGCAYALHAAASSIGLHACFGAWESGFGEGSHERYVPIVYLAEAADMLKARKLHRWVWSQGLVPWLLIAVGDKVLICPGFEFPAEAESSKVVRTVLAPDVNSDAGILKDFSAVRLRSSLQWRDFRLQAAGAVDKRLLRALEHLHQRLAGAKKTPALTASLINRLIGRVLYSCLLWDRRVLPMQWRADNVAVDRSDLAWPQERISVEAFWTLQEQIDDIFNGAVFVLTPEERSLIGQQHLDLAIDYLRRGMTLHQGGEQTDLFEIDLTAIQIETLSAVYEEFLRSESSDSVRAHGVVYTPPFLVDFVVNRLDDEKPFSESSRILDPTAGSGVFLVAAYRRIVERVLAERRERHLPIAELRGILTDCIYGVEKAESAASVAAFSLYLNLLEYADQSELAGIVKERRRPRVFPPLIGTNLMVADFFESTRHFEKVVFTCVAGNPPWKPLSSVSDCEVTSTDLVDLDEASEHVTWRALRNYLGEGGILGLVMPSTSMASPSAKSFLTALGRAFHVRAIVNLSQWRRHLFENAEHPAALLFVSKTPVSHSSRTSFYTPILWTQPFEPKAMWTLAVDCSDIQSMPSTLVFSKREYVFDAYALRPLDRAAKARLRQAVARGTATTLADLLKKLGLTSAGGSTPKRTLLDVGEICNAADLAVYGEGYHRLENHPKQLTQERLAACSPTHRAKFSGERLLVSRSLTQVISVGFPLAFNSTMNAIHWKTEPDGLSKSKQAALLRKLGRFLMSDFARFQFALFGQLWQVDRTRVEQRDLDAIVTPLPEYFLADDEGETSSRLELQRGLEPSEVDPSEVDFISEMKLQDVTSAMTDYLTTRRQFENGLAPADANSPVQIVPEEYFALLTSSLRNTFGRLFVGCKSPTIDDTCVRIQVEVLKPLPKPVHGPGSRFQFYDSAHVTWTAGQTQIYIEKPLGRLYFTLDRAYGDGLRIANLLLDAQ